MSEVKIWLQENASSVGVLLHSVFIQFVDGEMKIDCLNQLI